MHINKSSLQNNQIKKIYIRKVITRRIENYSILFSTRDYIDNDIQEVDAITIIYYLL